MGQENLDLFLILAVFNTMLRLEDESKHDSEQNTVLHKLDEILKELKRIGGAYESDKG